MAASLTHHPEQGCLVVTVTEPLTFELIVASYTEWSVRPNVPGDVNTVWDLRKAELSHVDLAFADRLVALRRSIANERGTARIALVVDGPAEALLMRLYQEASRELPQEIGIFRDIATALDWAGVGSAPGAG
jgi:hypothetical protein